MASIADHFVERGMRNERQTQDGGWESERQGLSGSPPHFPTFESFWWGGRGQRMEVDHKDMYIY
jgi:hypothetical protein